MASHAALPHRRFVRQPVLALLVTALIAVLLGLPFLSVAPNRLVTGQGVPLAAVLEGAWWGLLAPVVLLAAAAWVPPQRALHVTTTVAAVALLAVLSYMGTPRYAVLSSIDQEIVAELIPQTHPGPFRQSIWADFRAGEYEAAQWEAAPTPALKNILHLMEEELEVACSESTL